MGFWERVAKKVQEKANLSESQYSTALEEQENTIIDFLSFNCCSETELDSRVWEIKKEILTLYTKEIAPTISKIEVFSHTLHATSVEAIYTLLQYIVAAEFAADISETLLFYKQTLSYAYFLKFEFQKSLSELFFDRIKAYRTMIKDFNHRGVLIDQKPFTEVVDKRVWQVRKLYYKSRRKLRTRIRKNPDKVAELDLISFEKDVGFDSVIAELKKILNLYEEQLPIIIGNGYNMSSSYRVVSRILAFISGWFLFYGFMQYFGLWQSFSSFILNLFV